MRSIDTGTERFAIILYFDILYTIVINAAHLKKMMVVESSMAF
jgi:hypothetical protein